MNYPLVFTDFVRNTLGVTTHKTIDVITKFMESFQGLLYVNDRDIDTFSRIPIMRIMPEPLHREY